MQGMQLFEYAVIRIVPRVEREEFINVGVIIYCRAQNFLQTLFDLNEKRLCAFPMEVDVLELYQRLVAFQQICAGGHQAGSIGKLSLGERFRWLTATKSTVVQTSSVHSGLCKDAGETLLKLFSQLVQ